MWLGRGCGSNGIRALGRGLRASASARAWRASVALRRQVLGLARAATGGARSLQAQLQVELHVELQVGPQRELRGVGQIVVRALLGRDRVRASPGAARRDVSRAVESIAGVDIAVIRIQTVSQSALPRRRKPPKNIRRLPPHKAKLPAKELAMVMPRQHPGPSQRLFSLRRRDRCAPAK